MVETPERRGQHCASSEFLDRKGNCRNPDGCTCDRIATLERQIAELRAERDQLQKVADSKVVSFRDLNTARANAAEADKARLSEAMREIIEKADYGTGAGLTADSVCEQIGIIARAALSGSGAGGWRLVPVEPTKEMQRAGERSSWQDRTTIADQYRAMLSAAPTATGGREP